MSVVNLSLHIHTIYIHILIHNIILYHVYIELSFRTEAHQKSFIEIDVAG